MTLWATYHEGEEGDGVMITVNKSKFLLLFILTLSLNACGEDGDGIKPVNTKATIPEGYGVAKCEIYSFFRKKEKVWVKSTRPEFLCVPEKDKNGELIWLK